MSGYVNPVFRPDFTDYPAPPQNRLAAGFPAIWPASNPVGTETTQGMQSATPVDQIAFMRPDGTPVMQSDLAAAHQQVQQAMQVAPTMVLGMMGTTAPGIRAFHGSPYDFQRFDTSKIGTGEGAQAYGHGLYFAEKEGTAQSYRDALTPTDVAPKGKMYEVNIGADPEQFLHWDKPLSEQSDAVKAALAAKVERMKQNTDPVQRPMQSWLDQYEKGTLPGSSVYASLGQGSPESAAAAWQQAGIPGIRYLDQGSRGAGAGTHNYVVFDAATIDILRKYGLAGLGVGLGATAAGTQQQSQ